MIIQRSNLVGDLKSYEPRPIVSVPDVNTAREQLRETINEMAKELPDQYEDSFTDWGKLQKAAFELAKLSITDTLVYDQVSTESAREKARQETDRLMISYEANQMIHLCGQTILWQINIPIGWVIFRLTNTKWIRY